jgi:hypothetical protein
VPVFCASKMNYPLSNAFERKRCFFQHSQIAHLSLRDNSDPDDAARSMSFALTVFFLAAFGFSTAIRFWTPLPFFCTAQVEGAIRAGNIRRRKSPLINLERRAPSFQCKAYHHQHCLGNLQFCRIFSLKAAEQHGANDLTRFKEAA